MRAAAGIGAPRLGTDARQIALEAVEALEQRRGLAVARQAFELGVALGDELTAERAIAVQRGPAGRTSGAPRLELERDLRTGGNVRLQTSGRRLDELSQSGLELT